ncbi:MAG: FAD-dependent oxidoreductase [Thermoleophilia bacterium]
MRHVVVIGAGVIGASTALRLAQRGVRVTVVDAGRVGGGTSATSFAWIGASHPALGPYLDLNVRGVAAWHALAAELGGPPWLSLPGCLTWSDDPAEQSRLGARVPELVAAGYAARVLERAEAQALEPHVDLGRTRTACLYPDEGWVDAPAMARAVLAVAAGLGATVYEDARVTGLLQRGDRVAGSCSPAAASTRPTSWCPAAGAGRTGSPRSPAGGCRSSTSASPGRSRSGCS